MTISRFVGMESSRDSNSFTENRPKQGTDTYDREDHEGRKDPIDPANLEIREGLKPQGFSHGIPAANLSCTSIHRHGPHPSRRGYCHPDSRLGRNRSFHFLVIEFK